MRTKSLRQKTQEELKQIYATEIITSKLKPLPHTDNKFKYEIFLPLLRKSILYDNSPSKVLSGHYDNPRCPFVRFNIVNVNHSNKYKICIYVITRFKGYKGIIDRVIAGLNRVLHSIGYNDFKIHNNEYLYDFGITKTSNYYNIHHYFPFNQENWSNYLFNINNYGKEEAYNKNKQLLQKCIISNLYGMGKGVQNGGYLSYNFKQKDKIDVDIYDDFVFRTGIYKPFTNDSCKFIVIPNLSIRTNVIIPICIGLGRKVSQGSGQVSRIEL
ncbi:MAG: hypothetical protein ACOCRK_10125 [bacterium]